MSLLDKFAPIAVRRRELEALGVDPFNVVQERVLSATEAIIDGRHTILAGTNNYLGLTFDPACIAAARAAIETQGTGTTGSRMANGTFAGHVALERELAEHFGRRGCIVFSTGFLANLGILSTVTGRGDFILLDADCHASIYDGCTLGGAEVIRFRHNDPGDLAKRLRRLGERASNTLIVVEGIYSMLGDRAPLAEIAAVKREFGAWLLVDEAHSIGVIGPCGLAAAVGVDRDVDFVTGTFSKSLGATGGFCVSDCDALDLIRYSSRAYVFTASPSPSLVASTRAALRCMRERPDLRERLWANAHALYARLQELGFQLGPEVSPVIAAMFGSREQALALWRGLLESGVYVNVMLPPATPAGQSLLRCSVSAAHTGSQIERIGDAFRDVRDALDRASAA
jgi:8-amino-7-oxononanoate synthase